MNKLKIKKYQETYYNIHKKELLLKMKQYREEHKDNQKYYQKQYRKIHRNKIKKYSDNYRLKNRKYLLEQKKNYYHKNKKEINKNRKEKYQNNKQKFSQQRKEYYLKNREKILEQQKNWQKLHKKERRKYHCNYIKTRRKIDINFRLRDYLRHRIYLALKGNLKLSTTEKLIGCSIDFLKNHLESNFTVGMSFSNYGKWHLDHIKPCASFDLSKLSEQRKCFHYTNLQPLWANDNISKGKKINFPIKEKI